MNTFTPQNWYWLRDDGAIYASHSQSLIAPDDSAYKAWQAAGHAATPWPRDEAGSQTEAALQAVLEPYGLYAGLDVLKSASRGQISAMMDAAAAGITGSAPLAEQLSWASKQDAARAFLAGSAGDAQLAMLQAEAEVTGETLAALSQKILASAADYAVAAGAIAGLRRMAVAEIDMAEDAAGVQAVMARVAGQIARLV